MMINPASKALSVDNINLQLLVPEKLLMDNGIPVYLLNNSLQNIVRIDFIFDAGSYFQNRPLQASATCSMLSESSQKHTAKYIAEKLDFYGAHLEKEVGRDFTTISLYCLKKQVNNLLPFVEEIIRKPKFSDKEFKKFIGDEKQKYANNIAKVQNIARLRFQELIFGEQHPYGKVLKNEDFNVLKHTDLQEFHQKYFTAKNCKVVIAGSVDDSIVNKINKHFGDADWSTSKKVKKNQYTIVTTKPDREYIQKQGALQSAICIGKAIINSDHKDFHKLSIANTLLGGYFGSRLMKNIREEKGYTYGIGSGVVSYKNQGLFCISTQTGTENTHLCVDEIFKELKFLRTNYVSNKELDLVKKYLIGEFIREIDGPLDMAERLKHLVQMGYTVDFFKNYLQTINQITPKDVIEVCEQYLHEDSMAQVVVGEFK